MTYRCQWALQHDGANYSAGEVIDLPGEVAAPLLRDGVLVEEEAVEAEPVEVKTPRRKRGE